MKEIDEDIIVGNLLRWGVGLAALIVGIGGILYLLRYGSLLPHYSLFRGEPSDFTTLRGIFSGVLTLHRMALIQFGLITLILTPVARVGFLLILFARRRDFTYVVLTLTVLLVLIYSLAGI